MKNAPELFPGLGLYMRAFYDCVNDRPHPEAGISSSVIREWGRDAEMEGEALDTLVRYVRLLDVTFVDHRAKKQAQQSKRK